MKEVFIKLEQERKIVIQYMAKFTTLARSFMSWWNEVDLIEIDLAAPISKYKVDSKHDVSRRSRDAPIFIWLAYFLISSNQIQFFSHPTRPTQPNPFTETIPARIKKSYRRFGTFDRIALTREEETVERER
ncbi:hypothetical protein M5K25_012568 [Dendrobium thyrsiflorum]|uniref:Retrotransposon gag domain-containing protein n=1 Tax=Dendrobium thyrsiflorum TaxID=117978 RepID=A0ABD0V540_DENTH